MSSYNNDREPTAAEIDRVVGQALRVRRRVKEHSGPHAVADCVWCGKEGKLYVNTDSGMWDCKKCEEVGNLWKLATRVGIRVREESAIVKAAGRIMKQAMKPKTPQRPVRDATGIDLAAATTACERLFKPEDKHGAAVGAYLKSRGFEDETIRRFKLGVTWIRDAGVAPELALGIPYLDGDKVPLVKMRNLAVDKDARKFRRTKGGYSGLFNADGIKGCEQVVLVEGELDAISLWQLGVHNVASTSLGAKKTIPEEWAELLENVDDVVLWYDDDDKGQEAATALMEQIGTDRCRLAFMPKLPEGVVAKDANDLLSKVPAEDARRLARMAIAEAKGVENTLIVKATAYVDAVEAEWNGADDTSKGVSTGWPCIDRLIAGVRLGEMTLVTGHTNHGKTTWMNQLLLNLARAGEPCMSSALENGPEMVARKFYQTEAGAPLSSLRTEEERREALGNIRRLDAIPLYILDLYGRQPLGPIIDAIKFARRRYGVRYVGLDHLNFIGKEDPRQDKVDFLDEVLQTFTELTRRIGIHLFLLAHPRGNVEDDVVPTGASVKGTSSAKQNCDNGVTVYRAMNTFGDAIKKPMKIKDPMGRKIEIELKPRDVLVSLWKVRHDDARVGSSVLDFDRGTLVYKSIDTTEAGASQEQGNGAEQEDFFNGADADPFEWGGSSGA